jgi:hypothetical protein
MRRARSVVWVAASVLVLAVAAAAPAGGGTPASPGTEAASPAASGTTGAGFASPEAAIRAYLAAVAAGDVEAILAASAAEEMARGFRFDLQAERLRSMMLATSLSPAEYPMFADINVAAQSFWLLGQVRNLVYGLLSGEEIDGRPIMVVDDPARVERFVANVDPSRLAALAVEDIRFSNAAFEDDPRWLENAARTAATYGADELTERLVLFSLGDQLYDLGFTLLRYGDGWKVANQNANLAGTSAFGTARPTTRDAYERAVAGE